MVSSDLWVTLLSPPGSFKLSRGEATTDSDEPKLKGAVRAIDLTHDGDHPNSFAVTIGIQIKTDGRVSYDEAERLATKYRREYLGKDVEFLAVSLPCPACGKVLNSESGLKGHIRQSHPERLDLLPPAKPEKKRVKKASPTKNGAKKNGKNPEKNGKASKKDVKPVKEPPRSMIEGKPKPKKAEPKKEAKKPAKPEAKSKVPPKGKAQAVAEAPKGKQLRLA